MYSNRIYRYQYRFLLIICTNLMPFSSLPLSLSFCGRPSLSTGPDNLLPNYDHVGMQMKFFDIRSPLKLTCNLINIETEAELIW